MEFPLLTFLSRHLSNTLKLAPYSSEPNLHVFTSSLVCSAGFPEKYGNPTVDFFIQTFVGDIAQRCRNRTCDNNKSITKQSMGCRIASWQDNFDSNFRLYYRIIGLQYTVYTIHILFIPLVHNTLVLLLTRKNQDCGGVLMNFLCWLHIQLTLYHFGILALQWASTQYFTRQGSHLKYLRYLSRTKSYEENIVEENAGCAAGWSDHD